MSTEQAERDRDNEIDNLIESISVTAGVEPDDSTTDWEGQEPEAEA